MENIDSLNISDDQILSALFGETVTVAGDKYTYKVSFDASSNHFHTSYNLGEMLCDEANLRLFRFY